jgi:23S rRNA (cytosine1962-C5)-methyltransferase
VIHGELPAELTVLEYGIKFQLDVAKAQKTGLFLDQREMRRLVGEYSKGRKVLNCFAYTGGFSLYAMRGGATKVDSMDISADVMKQAELNFKINGFDITENKFVAADVFKFLRESDLNYDLVILDPPAFAKKRSDIDKASGAYRDINRLAMQKMPANSFLLTCSCSYFIDEEIFQRIVFQAATMSGRKVRIVQKHHLAADHPVNIYHPEGDYLKSLLLYIE